MVAEQGDQLSSAMAAGARTGSLERLNHLRHLELLVLHPSSVIGGAQDSDDLLTIGLSEAKVGN